MRILVTGSQGFIGKNLVAELQNRGNVHIYQFDIDTDPRLLEEYTKDCEFVFHLAGVNRPQDVDEFIQGNLGFTATLLDALKTNGNTCPVMLASSVQAKLDNPYGRSKKAGEDLLLSYGGETGAKVLVYRFPNVFGKWSRPNYNSVVATFCHNIARDLPIKVNDPTEILSLVYIDDVVNELISCLNGEESRDGDVCIVPGVHSVALGDVAELICSFKTSRAEGAIPVMSDPFVKELYSTYLSYLPTQHLSYDLKMNIDRRGSFTEFIRTPDRGQVSVNICRPGVTKGNHWHHTKNEKFLVVSGHGVIRLRKVGFNEVTELYVSGDKLEVVDIPPGYTHNIENLGNTDLITIMWANETFDPDKPDTFFLEV